MAERSGRAVLRHDVPWTDIVRRLSPEPSITVVVLSDGDEAPVGVTLRALEASTNLPVVVLETHGRRTGSTLEAALACARPSDDLVLVSPGTVVTPGVVERLSWVAALGKHDTVSAVSTIAGPYALAPRDTESFDWPLHLTAAEMGAVAAGAADEWAADVDSPSDLCVLVRREFAESLSGRDEPFSATGRHALAPHALVSVHGGPGTTRVDTVGDWAAGTRTPRASGIATDWRDRILDGLSAAGAREGLDRTVLHVVSRHDPRSFEQTLALLRAVRGRRILVLDALDGQTIALSELVAGHLEQRETWSADDPFRPDATHHDGYAGFVASVLDREAVDSVHVWHLACQPVTTVAEVAARMGVPTVVTVTGRYLVSAPPTTIAGSGDQSRWRRAVHEMLIRATAIVTSDASAADRFANLLDVPRDRFAVVESTPTTAALAPMRADGLRRPGPPRALALTPWPGSDGPILTRHVAELTAPWLEWHVLGDDDVLPAEIAVTHGSYDARELAPLVAEIDPDVAVLLTSDELTTAPMLAESWALRVPVVATGVGELGHRIEAYGGGVLAPPGSIEGVAKTVQDVATGIRTVPPLDPCATRSIATTSQDVAALVHRGRRRVPCVGIMSINVGHGTQSIRVERLAVEAERRGFATFRRVDPQDLISGADRSHYDALLIQRTSLSYYQAVAIGRAAESRGIPIAVDLDDDLLEPSLRARLLRSGITESYINGLAHILSVCSRAIVSTEPLRAVISSWRPDQFAVVIPNRLDPRLWSATLAPVAARPTGDRLFYMGTMTHHKDLELLVEPLDIVNSRRSSRVVLDILGVSRDDLPSPHMSRLKPPPMPYPDFVTWMRARASQWVGAVAPLAFDVLNESKSDLKLLEYALGGLPAAATDFGPYRDRHDLALLVDNSPEQWAAAIEHLVDRQDAARGLQRSAARHVASTRVWTPELVQEWVDTIVGGRVVA